jgi:hypothetical protein
MRGAQAGQFGQGLIVVGAIGVALNIIMLSLDWIAFDDRSNTESLLLLVSILGVLAGGWLLRSPRAALAGVLAGILFGSLFLFAAACFAWLKSGYFFPTRSRLLLRVSLAALVSSAALMALSELRRRRAHARVP